MDPNQDQNQQPPVGDQGGQPVQDPGQPAGGAYVPPAPEQPETPVQTPESPMPEPTAPEAPTEDQGGTDQTPQQ